MYRRQQRREHFSPRRPFRTPSGRRTCETCNTYNMLKLTRHLFLWNPGTNMPTITSGCCTTTSWPRKTPKRGLTFYFAPLNGPAKLYGTPEDSFWCCYGTGIENNAKYGDSIYFHNRGNGGNGLFVNLFVASELTWKQQGLTLRQETRFPESDTSRLTFRCQKPVTLTVHVRQPYWAASGIEIAVNGRRQAVESRGSSYAEITRQWQMGDTVEIRADDHSHRSLPQ